MAIFHFTAKMVSREKGQSVVAAAAYRAALKLKEVRTGITWDFTKKRGVEHSEILSPPRAPDWILDRSRLWNAVDAIERRKDAQLARDVEIALPLELDAEQQVDLLRDFVQQHFVSKGMIADCNIHRDNPNNPHAHVLLSLRSIGPTGFGLKERAWNQKSMLQSWRAGWAEIANEHLARAGLSIRIDHRTLKAQGLDLVPGRKIGVSLERQRSTDLPPGIADRVAEQRDIATENGDRILADPRLALRALTHHRATFTTHDIARFLNTRTDGADQFRAAYLKVTTSDDLVSVGRDDWGRQRYTSREMLEAERELLHNTESLALRTGHAVALRHRGSIVSHHTLNDEQTLAFGKLIDHGDLKTLVGIAGSGKSRLLGAAREAWEAAGYTVKGATLSGIAADNLEAASGITSRTIASYEYAWKGGRDPLTSSDILVIDEAGMVGTRQLARVLDAAKEAGAKVVLVGDPEQLQAIEAGAPFRAIVSEVGAAELNQVVRQRHDWQKEATRSFSSAGTKEGLQAYAEHGLTVHASTRQDARSALLSLWSHDTKHSPNDTQIIFAYTRDDARHLNESARQLKSARGELGYAENIATESGVKPFAVGDRLYFLRNEKSLGVKNGTLGTIQQVSDGVLLVGLDGNERCIAVDTRFYAHLDYGYAATIYKAQGVTVDRAYVLATPHLDRHSTYVSMSRHRESATMFYAAEDFAGKFGWQKRAAHDDIHQEVVSRLSRPQLKDMVHDYPEANPEASVFEGSSEPKTRRKFLSMDEIEATQQRASQRWQQRQHARELEIDHPGEDHAPELTSQFATPEDDLHIHSNSDPLEHSRGGIEDELDL